jgi:hypothetical protein
MEKYCYIDILEDNFVRTAPKYQDYKLLDD